MVASGGLCVRRLQGGDDDCSFLLGDLRLGCCLEISDEIIARIVFEIIFPWGDDSARCLFDCRESTNGEHSRDVDKDCA